MAQKGLEGHGDQDKWRRGERKRSGPCRVRVGSRELDGRRLTSLSGQGGRDSVQPGCGSCPALWSGQPVPALKLRPSDGSSAHTGTLPAPRRYHWHCQGGSCCGLWDQVGALSSSPSAPRLDPLSQKGGCTGQSVGRPAKGSPCWQVDSVSVVTSPMVPLLPALPGFCAPLST